MEMIENSLANLNVLNTFEGPAYIKIEAKTQKYISCCVYCQSVSLDKHGHSEIRLVDAPIKSKKVFLFVKRQRYRCCECGKTFFEPVHCQYRHLRMTKNLACMIKKKSYLYSVSGISQQAGVDRATIKRVILSAGYSEKIERNILI